jgi:hypothetical protein
MTREIRGKSSYENHFNKEQQERSEILCDIIKKYAKPTDSILEIGCSWGRNLETLYDNGFKNLTGIDAHEEAIKGIRNKDIKGIVGAMQDKLKELPQYDIIFTKSVLYLTPDPNYQDIVDKVKKYLITCEGEGGQHVANPGLFDRNYKAIFELYEMEQIEEREAFAGVGTRIRVFKKCK